MSRYAKIMDNDVVDGEGVCVSFWVQGCSLHCEGCHNPSTWNFHEGQLYTPHTKWKIIEAISANGIQRNFSVLGGEPLAPENINMTLEVIDAVRHAYPNITIYLWTGYEFDDLIRRAATTEAMQHILIDIDVLIDGPFIESQKDLTLKLRGSTNQHIRIKKEGEWIIDE